MSERHQHDQHGQGCGCGHQHGAAASRDDWPTAPAEAIVCHCLGLTKAQIVSAIEQGAFTVALVKTMTGAGRGNDCQQKHPLGHSCEGDLQRLVEAFGRPPEGYARGGGCGCH